MYRPRIQSFERGCWSQSLCRSSEGESIRLAVRGQREGTSMKMALWACIAAFLILSCSEQAAAGELWWSITRKGETGALMNHKDRSGILYPGEYNVRITIYNDGLMCTLRVGTKSSNLDLMKISGPLAVSVEKSHLPKFSCSAIGTVTVSNPSTVAVPVVMTLTYGPALTKTFSILIAQKVAINSAVAFPNQLAYNRGARVTANANLSRKFFSSEPSLRFYWRVKEGKLCDVSIGNSYLFDRVPLVEASAYWREGPVTSNDLQMPVLGGTLCGSGRTIVEITWRHWLTTWRNNISTAQDEQQKIMAEFSSKSVGFNVSLLPSGTTSGIRSRDIETPSESIIPDPESPDSQNFEQQGEKP